MSKKVLVVVAHPAEQSLCAEIANRFAIGMRIEAFGDVDVSITNIFVNEEGLTKLDLLALDGLVLAFPNWCEMPPAPMVAWIQRHMSEGIGYSRDCEGVKTGHLQGLPVFTLITQGTDEVKDYIIGSVREALEYCGAEVGCAVFPGVGRSLDVPTAFEIAETMGRTFYSTNLE